MGQIKYYSIEELLELFKHLVLKDKPIEIYTVGRQNENSIIIQMKYNILLIFRYYGEKYDPEYRVEQLMGPTIEDVIGALLLSEGEKKNG